MKRLASISCILLLLLSEKVFCQNNSYITNTTNYNKGIYLSFVDFKYNKPSLPLNFDIIPKNHRYGVLNLGGKHIEYLLDIPKDSLVAIRDKYTKIWGICDGENLYVCPGFYKELRLKTDTRYEKFQFTGIFCYFEEVAIEFFSGVHEQPGYETVLKGKVIYMNDGEMFTLTKSVMKRILSTDMLLLKDFRKKSKERKYEKKNKKFILETHKQFIIWYNEQHNKSSAI